jgi:hypothetical protein
MTRIRRRRSKQRASRRARDGSGHGFDAATTDVAEVPRVMSPAVADDDAAGFSTSSKMTIAGELGLTGSVTVEMWAQTAFSNSKLFDSSGRIYLARNGEDQFECGLGGSSNESVDGATDLGRAWHHVACVFDASSRELRVYVDGDVDDCKTLDRGIDVSRNGPTTLGAGSLGAIDSVHVFAQALTPADLCNSAGRTGCQSTCPIEPIEQGGNGPGNGGPGGG